MAQNYTLIPNTTKLSDSLSPLLERDDSAASCFSGTVFPSTNLLLGMQCYRTDQLKLYQLTNLSGPIWTLTHDLSSGAAYSPYASSVAWSGVTGKPSTISGYGITDALNKTGDTASGKIAFAQSLTTGASIQLPHGAAPFSPVDGDVWTTGSGAYFRISGGTYVASFQNSAETYTAKKTFQISSTAAASLNVPSGSNPSSPVAGDLWATSTNIVYCFGAGDSRYVAFWDNSGLMPVANGGTGANNAASARANLGISDLPAGLVIYTAMSYAPSGFLKANGAAVSRSTYSALFAAIGTTYGGGDGSSTFNLPDLRGEFIRGWDDGRTLDNGRGFASVQGDQMQRMTGSFYVGPYQLGASGAFSQVNRSGTMGTGSGNRGTTNFDSAGSPGAKVSSDTYGETRPRNVALLACIKY